MQTRSLSGLDQIAHVVEEFAAAFSDDSESLDLLDDLRRRLHSPLRVGIVGPVSGGKTTLVHALLGNVVAATGAGETTRFLTWFHGGEVESAALKLSDGRDRSIYLSDDGRLPDWAEVDGEDVVEVHVTLPTAPLLRQLTLIDTPGLFSLRDENSARSRRALVGEETGSELDALIFLTSGQQVEIDALADFCSSQDGGLPGASNVIAVVSKVDQIGGSEDPMVAGARKAARLRDEPQLRLLVSDVLPVIGLVAETVRTDALRQVDLEALRRLVADESAMWALLSVELLERSSPAEELDGRRRLVRLLGLHGVRVAVGVLRAQPSVSIEQLGQALLDRSGFPELEAAVWRLFVPRADVLKADRALGVLRELSGSADPQRVGALRSLVESCLLGPTGQAVGLLDALRRVQMQAARVPAWVEQVLVTTANGGSARDLVDVGAGATDQDVHSALTDLLARLARYTNTPLVPARSAEVASLLRSRIAALMAEEKWSSLRSEVRHA